MIQKVRNKFILTAMLAMTFCVVLLIGSINIINYRQVDAQLVSVFDEMVNKDQAHKGNKGNKDNIDNEELPSDNRLEKKNKRERWHPTERLYQGRYYRIVLSDDENVPPFVSNEDMADEDVLSLTEQILEATQKPGGMKDYKYRIQDGEDETVIHILDCSTEWEAVRRLLLISICIGAAGLLLIFLFVYYMSGKAVAPLQESMDKQKQFITDASHELKTPVSVISTNMEVLKLDLGAENEWIDSTQRQIKKLRKLINHLVSLSRLEETAGEVERTQFSLSEAVKDCVEVYETMAEAEGKILESEVTEEISFYGEEKSIREMLTVLFENAVKYSTDESKIRVVLYREGKKIIFTTENAWAKDVKKEELDRLFERFYRGDKSRNRDQKNSGYGLGLAIARSAATRNRGSLTVSENEAGNLVFKCVFRL